VTSETSKVRLNRREAIFGTATALSTALVTGPSVYAEPSKPKFTVCDQSAPPSPPSSGPTVETTERLLPLFTAYLFFVTNVELLPTTANDWKLTVDTLRKTINLDCSVFQALVDAHTDGLFDQARNGFQNVVQAFDNVTYPGGSSCPKSRQTIIDLATFVPPTSVANPVDKSKKD
jgi:hypothetical protein